MEVDLIGLDLTLDISDSKASDLRIIMMAAFRLVLSVLESDRRF